MLEKEEEEGYDLIKIPVEIEGQDIDAVLDTGATRSVISEELAKKLNIKYKESKEKVRLADGNTILIIGSTEKVRVRAHGSKCEINFIILSNNVIPMLLGVDWFCKTHATLNVEKQEITFNSKHQVNGVYRSKKMEEEYLTQTLLMDDTYEETIEDEDWEQMEKKPIREEFEYNKELKPEENERLYKLLEKFALNFAYSTEDLKNPCTVYKHEIKVTCTEPIYQQPYRRSQKDNELIRKEVQKMLKNGIIRISVSPWSSPVVIITSKDGSKRFCIDFRKVNLVTLRDPFPMPRIDDIFDSLAGCVIFSTFDGKKGFWQIELDEKSKPITAFTTSEGHYECNRLPFGGKGGPAAFNRVIAIVFAGASYILNFIDDLIIKSKSIEEHFEHLEDAFKRLENANIKLNIKKCSFFKKEINILGHTITKNTIKMNCDKVKAIQNWTTPFKVKHVQAFLGITGYYRKFIRDFAKIAAPLYKLLCKDTKFNWNEDCQKAFEELKKALMSYPILRMPDFSKEFFLYTDASGLAIGAILAQKTEKGEE